MHPSQIPEKPLQASVNTQLQPTEKIFFLKKANGTILNMDERGAWNVLRGNQVFRGKRGKFRDEVEIIGVSDGLSYLQAVKESHEIFKTKGLDAAQAHLRNALNAELERCRGKIEMPRNYDMTDEGGNPVDINLLR
jgi:hypothetical protein